MTEELYNHIQLVQQAGLEEADLGIGTKYIGKEERACFVPRSLLMMETEDPLEEQLRMAQGPHEHNLFLDKHDRAINAKSNGEPHDLRSLRQMFQQRLSVEIQQDGSSLEYQRAYVARINGLPSRGDQRLTLREGLSPTQLPYELAKRTHLMIIRSPKDRNQLVTSWGLTTIHNNMGLCYDEFPRRKYSFHYFSNSHPERLFGASFKYKSDPMGTRRPVKNMFGARINDKESLRLEDFPTYGKSSKAHASTVLPYNASPLPPLRSNSTLRSNAYPEA
jgi:hypothetical protein